MTLSGHQQEARRCGCDQGELCGAMTWRTDIAEDRDLHVLAYHGNTGFCLACDECEEIE